MGKTLDPIEAALIRQYYEEGRLPAWIARTRNHDRMTVNAVIAGKHPALRTSAAHRRPQPPSRRQVVKSYTVEQQVAVQRARAIVRGPGRYAEIAALVGMKPVEVQILLLGQYTTRFGVEC